MRLDVACKCECGGFPARSPAGSQRAQWVCFFLRGCKHKSIVPEDAGSILRVSCGWTRCGLRVAVRVAKAGIGVCWDGVLGRKGPGLKIFTTSAPCLFRRRAFLSVQHVVDKLGW
jgi:hypothetical protein